MEDKVRRVRSSILLADYSAYQYIESFLGFTNYVLKMNRRKIIIRVSQSLKNLYFLANV